MWKQAACVLCLGLMIQPASAQIYTWTDSKGVKHASDQPPPDVEVKTVKGGSRPLPPPAANASAPAAGAAASAPKTWQEKELDSRQRKAAQTEAADKAQKEATAKAEREAYCQALRSNLSMYEGGGRVTRPNAKGEKEYLTDAQLKQEADNTRAQMTRDCR